MTRYIHSHTIWSQGRMMVVPAGFKPAGKSPVKGGRWKIRKRVDGTWSAWSTGKSGSWRRQFKTHAEAIEWACLVIQCYDLYSTPREANLVIRAIRDGYKVTNGGW